MARWLTSQIMLVVGLAVGFTMAQEPVDSNRDWPGEDDSGLESVTSAPRDGNWGGHRRRGFDGDHDFDEYSIDQRVDRYLSSFKSVYDLNDNQVKLVRERLKQLKVKELEYNETYREQGQKLDAELHELWEKRRNGEEVDTERMRELIEERGRIRRNSPLMSWDNVTEEIEKLLPAKQVAKSRKRLEERRREDERRRDETHWLNKVKRGLRADPSEKDSWDRYVEGFVRMFQLDDSQQSTAGSIMRNFKQLRDIYRESKRDEYKGLLSLADIKERDKKMEELRQPVDRLFEDLKTELDRIPTSAQKALVLRASNKSVQTRPVDWADQPDEADTQPADVRTTLGPTE